VLPPHGLFEFLSGVTQRPSHALVDLWFSTRLYGKVWGTTVRDSRGANEDRADEGINKYGGAGVYTVAVLLWWLVGEDRRTL
jgi:hypothetical protein